MEELLVRREHVSWFRLAMAREKEAPGSKFGPVASLAEQAERPDGAVSFSGDASALAYVAERLVRDVLPEQLRAVVGPIDDLRAIAEVLRLTKGIEWAAALAERLHRSSQEVALPAAAPSDTSGGALDRGSGLAAEMERRARRGRRTGGPAGCRLVPVE